ncbi:MAG: Translation initiation factor IF-3 [candidate division TM6 bacterium GW2011_GWF2_38_10]|nr:MAG: Translation initiation factor IF-3 [candidate division TM6 bacterium GW2011_GWF2_38_10]
MSKAFKDKPNGDPQGKHFVNEQIRATSLLVIGPQGENLGQLSRHQALAQAQDAGLDLVQVGEKDSLIIAKIMDFGKFLYSKKKQLSDAKKHQKVIQIKEVKMRPNIGDQDYKTKLNQASAFLVDGKKVKFTLQFKGREISMMDEFGKKMFLRITQDLTAQNIGTLVEEKESRGGPFWSKIIGLKEK